MSDALTLYKLIILFILDKVDFPLTNAQLSNFILEKEYTNYFNIQQSINELESTGLIKKETIRNSSLFRITSAGTQTLSFFDNEISDAIKSDILNYLKANRYSLREEVSTQANYYNTKNGEFIAHCYVIEKKNKLIEIHLNETFVADIHISRVIAIHSSQNVTVTDIIARNMFYKYLCISSWRVLACRFRSPVLIMYICYFYIKFSMCK